MNGKRMTGVMLLEVVLAIAIFAFGMLALVQLQGNLARSSADANTRTVATNIAEEFIEPIRGYQHVTADAANGLVDYMELFGNEQDDTVTRGGIDYERTVTINDFWYDAANDAFIRTDATDPPTPPVGLEFLAHADFKMLEVNVAWSPNPLFYVDDENTANLGTDGSAVFDITIYEIIPSSPPALGAKVAADINEPPGTPPVNYTPGERPNIVALKLDGAKLKESTTPVPDVIRSGELTETYFEVVSYNDAAAFLRREEFLTVGCECTLDSSPDSAAGEGGFRPTLWAGFEYTEAEFVTKSFGTSANNVQSVFCDTCCRDHHDGGTGEFDDGKDVNDIPFEEKRLVYDPWADVIAPDKDHDHYSRSKKGDITVAGDGDVYLEACRMIRKDGFFRVAQDFNQQGFFGFPEDYLDNLAEVGEYSAYVTAAIDDFYGKPPFQTDLKLPGDAGMPEFTNPADGNKYPFIPSSRDEDKVALAGPPTNLPTMLGADNQQLRSRGIYLDYMTDEVKEKIALCPGAGCQLPKFTTALEIYPFFEVQLTSLANWTEDPLNEPVDVTDEAIKSNNTHSRGRADLKVVGMGKTKSDFGIHKGNVGIAGTDPIRIDDPQAADLETDYVYINTLDSGIPSVVGFEIIGEILSGVGGVRATDVELSFNEAQCGKTPTGYRCVVPNLAILPTVTVSNYFKTNKTLYACSDADEGGLGDGVDLHDPNSTTFDLPKANKPTADIVIEDTPCV